MLTNNKLCALKATLAKEYNITSATKVKSFKIAHTKANFFFTKDTYKA
jgi:hypothetical protein